MNEGRNHGGILGAWKEEVNEGAMPGIYNKLEWPRSHTTWISTPPE